MDGAGAERIGQHIRLRTARQVQGDDQPLLAHAPAPRKRAFSSLTILAIAAPAPSALEEPMSVSPARLPAAPLGSGHIPALDAVLTCRPDHVVLGMSSETFWDGLAGSRRLRRSLEKRAGVGVTLGSDACRAALRACGRSIRRLGIVTPYMPVGDRQVRRFFADCGYEIVHLLGLRCRSPVLIAHEPRERLREAILRVNRGKVDAIVQVGTNLAMAALAAEAEGWLGKPVIAINTATYWHALREYGIRDKVYGWGSLLAEH